MNDWREQLHAAQGGKCATCDEAADLVVDHDHQTQLVRGLLCSGCNVREGSTFHGSHSVFVRYRENPPAAQIGLVMRYTRPGERHRPGYQLARKRAERRADAVIRMEDLPRWQALVKEFFAEEWAKLEEEQ